MELQPSICKAPTDISNTKMVPYDLGPFTLPLKIRKKSRKIQKNQKRPKEPERRSKKPMERGKTAGPIAPHK